MTTRRSSRSPNGAAVSPERRTRAARRQLQRFIQERRKANDLEAWRRGRAILGYIEGRRVIELAQTLDVARASINRWLLKYNARGLEGLLTGTAPGPERRLSPEQMDELGQLIDAGPQDSGFTSGVWTGPIIAALIKEKYDVSYHSQHIPRLLHIMGFSLQRPRKRLAKANAEAQRIWRRKVLPALKKSEA